MSRVRQHEQDPLRVLFVCTANVCRSPYTERRAEQLAGACRLGGLVLASAGVPGVDGRGMDHHMAAELRARGGDPNGHVSRALTAGILEHTDVVVTVEFAHRLRIIQTWPDQAAKVFGLRQLAHALGRVRQPTHGLEALDAALAVSDADGLTLDIEDPHGRGAAAARACADEIDDLLTSILPALAR